MLGLERTLQRSGVRREHLHCGAARVQGTAQAQPPPCQESKAGEEQKSYVLFLWSQLVRKTDVTKEIKADTVHAQALQDYTGGKGAAGKGAALLQLLL